MTDAPDIVLINYSDDSLQIVQYIIDLSIVMLLLWYVVREVLVSGSNIAGYKAGFLGNSTASAIAASTTSAADLAAGRDDPSNTPEDLVILHDDVPLNIPFTDDNYKYKPLAKGLYGGVPVMFYNDFDDYRAKDFRVVDGGLYIPNSREYWKWDDIPVEAAAWSRDTPNLYKPEFFPTYP